MKCKKCGSENPEEAIFCIKCGEKIEKEIWEGEKRVCSVLFLDLKGFTSLSERLEPEEIREIIDKVFSNMTEIIEKYGGYVDKYIGDAIMALFGAPVSHGDDAERAILSALEMQKKLKEINKYIKEISNVELKMRIGINTAEVVTGKIGKKREGDYTALGDTVNTAQRIESVCDPGKIFVSESTYELTKEIFNFRKIPSVHLKGKAKQISLYEVIGYKDKATEEIKEILKDSEFVGREKEMNFLIDFFEKSKEKAVFLFLKGEIGSGKTRLMNEFEKVLRKRIEKINIKWIYPDPLSSSLVKFSESLLRKYYPLKDYLYKIKKNEESREIGEYLDYILDPQKQKTEIGNEKERRSIIFYSFLYFIRTLCENEHNVLIIENTHFLDELSISLLDYLSKHYKGGNLFLIALVRNNFYKEKNLNLLSDFDTLELSSFSFQEIKEFIEKNLKLRNYDEKILSEIMKKSLGIPLYLKNIIHVLYSGNYLKKKNGEVLFVKDISELKLPDILIDLVQATIDSLEQEEKEILTFSSFLGDRFEVRVLETVSGRKKIFLKPKLETLVLKGILESEREGEIYKFKSPVYKDAIFDRLLKSSRKILHRRIAERLESEVKRENILAVIAFNYEKAGETEKAINYYKELLEKSILRVNYEEAIKYAKKLIKLAKDEKLLSYAKLKLAECLKNEGKVEESVIYFKELINKKNEEALYSYLDFLIFIKGEYKKAEELLLEALDTWSIKEKSKAFLYLGFCNHYQRKLEEAKNNYLTALKYAKKEGYITGIVLNSLGGIYEYENELEKALFYYQKALEYKKKYGKAIDIAPTLHNIANLYYRMEKFEEAKRYFEEGLKICEKEKYRPGMGKFYYSIGGYYLKKGDYFKAMEYFQKALQIFKIFDMKNEMALVYNNMAIVYSRKLLYNKSIEFIEKFIDISRKAGKTKDMTLGLYNLSRFYLLSGDIENAEKENENALKLSVDNKYDDIRGLSLMNKGDILIIKGKNNEALSCYLNSLELLKKINIQTFILKNYIRLLTFYILQKDLNKAEEYYNKAEKISKKAGDKEAEINILLLKGIMEKERKEKKEDFLRAIQIANETKNTRMILKSFYLLSEIDESFKDKFKTLFDYITKDIKEKNKDNFLKALKLL